MWDRAADTNPGRPSRHEDMGERRGRVQPVPVPRPEPAPDGVHTVRSRVTHVHRSEPGPDACETDGRDPSAAVLVSAGPHLPTRTNGPDASLPTVWCAHHLQPKVSWGPPGYGIWFVCWWTQKLGLRIENTIET